MAMKTLTQSKFTMETKTVKEFLKLIPKINAPLSFQANRNTRWLPDESSKYISSLVTGKAPNPFILADIESCYNFAVKHNLKRDKKFFKRLLKKGYKYIVVDGNNRKINIKAFSENKFGIEPANYVMNNFNYSIFPKTKKTPDGNDHFEDLPEALGEAFEEAEVTLHIYTEVTERELSELFIRVNSGKALNHPEKRNAINSDIADIIRDLALTHENFLYNDKTKFFTEEGVNRRDIDDFIAGCAYIFFRGDEASISANTLEQLYLDETLSLPNNFKTHFNKFINFIKCKTIYASDKRNMLLDLYVIFTKMEKSNMNFRSDKNKSDFIKEYLNVVASVIRHEEFYDYDDSIKSGKKNTKKTFEKMLGGRQDYNNRMRYLIVTTDYSNGNTKWLNLDEWFVKRDKKRVISNIDKMVKASEQNWKTPENKEIEPSELQTEKFHKGHIVPHADGGETTKDNTVIQLKNDNLKLGKKKLVLSDG